MKPELLLRRLARGDFRNVAFEDVLALAEGFGFRLDRIRGSHRVLYHPRLRLRINLQPVHGQAKPYQIRQLLKLIEGHRLEWDDGGND
jgi:predicted RNA binding protein YcfA (HicA-like mRNA interferase family)